MKTRLTKEVFIRKAQEIHGDKYNYSKVEEVKWHSDICIICPIHGEFHQTVSNHLAGKGCLQCSLKTRGEKRRNNTKLFIEKAKSVHGDLYDYSKVNYTKSINKVCIVCKKHGDFWMLPTNHLQGQKCPICQREKNANIQRSNKDEFEKKARIIHGNKYDYSKVQYVNNLTPVEIICPEHGSFFQLPSNHLKGEKCWHCGRKITEDARRLNTEKFIEMAKKVHGDKYDYSLVSYTKSTEKVKIICPKHGVFEQIANNHLRGKGCSRCKCSHGEEEIQKELDKYDINYIPQYCFQNEDLFCENKTLRVDFYLPSINTVIEYNGQQHYREVPLWDGNKGFFKRKTRDIILRIYCKEHHIKLVEIPYTEFKNIKDIIKKVIKGKRCKTPNPQTTRHDGLSNSP